MSNEIVGLITLTRINHSFWHHISILGFESYFIIIIIHFCIRTFIGIMSYSSTFKAFAMKLTIELFGSPLQFYDKLDLLFIIFMARIYLILMLSSFLGCFECFFLGSWFVPFITIFKLVPYVMGWLTMHYYDKF